MRQECPVLKALIKKHSLYQEMLTIQFLTHANDYPLFIFAHARANSHWTTKIEQSPFLDTFVIYQSMEEKAKAVVDIVDRDNDTLNLTVLPILWGLDYEFLNLLLPKTLSIFFAFTHAGVWIRCFCKSWCLDSSSHTVHRTSLKCVLIPD